LTIVAVAFPGVSTLMRLSTAVLRTVLGCSAVP
jgi:hypothetical protein